MSNRNKHPDQPNWDRHAPVVPFVGKKMRDKVFSRTQDVVWRPVAPRFQSPMKFLGLDRGVTTVLALIEDANGYVYPTPVSNFEKIALTSKIDHGVIPNHEWRFVKRGNSYFIELVE